MVLAALSALSLSAAAVSITPTQVKFNASDNALFIHYNVSGATSECGGLQIKIYDVEKSTEYLNWSYLKPEIVTAGEHSAGVRLEGSGLNSDDVEDGKPPVLIELSVVDTCSVTPYGDFLVLASGEIKVPDGNGSSTSGSSGGGTTVRHYQKKQTLTGVVWTDDGVAVLTIKTGKVSKKGIVAVSGSIMGMDGKKLAVKSVKLPVDSEERLNGTLQVKGGSTIDITSTKTRCGATGRVRNSKATKTRSAERLTPAGDFPSISSTRSSGPTGRSRIFCPRANPSL